MSFKVGDIVMSNCNEDTVYIVVNTTNLPGKVDLSVLIWCATLTDKEDLCFGDYIYRDIEISLLRKINLKDLTKRLVNYLLED